MCIDCYDEGEDDGDDDGDAGAYDDNDDEGNDDDADDRTTYTTIDIFESAHGALGYKGPF
jgi:hypothetical protein